LQNQGKSPVVQRWGTTKVTQWEDYSQQKPQQITPTIVLFQWDLNLATRFGVDLQFPEIHAKTNGIAGLKLATKFHERNTMIPR